MNNVSFFLSFYIIIDESWCYGCTKLPKLSKGENLELIKSHKPKALQKVKLLLFK